MPRGDGSQTRRYMHIGTFLQCRHINIRIMQAYSCMHDHPNLLEVFFPGLPADIIEVCFDILFLIT